jgi:hypothetical protein
MGPGDGAMTVAEFLRWASVPSVPTTGPAGIGHPRPAPRRHGRKATRLDLARARLGGPTRADLERLRRSAEQRDRLAAEFARPTRADVAVGVLLGVLFGSGAAVVAAVVLDAIIGGA